MIMQHLLEEVHQFLFSKTLPKLQNIVMFKYGIVDFAYVHQAIISLARTGIFFQNILFIMLISINYIRYEILKVH